jgi:hypothetical protein
LHNSTVAKVLRAIISTFYWRRVHAVIVKYADLFVQAVEIVAVPSTYANGKMQRICAASKRNNNKRKWATCAHLSPIVIIVPREQQVKGKSNHADEQKIADLVADAVTLAPHLGFKDILVKKNVREPSNNDCFFHKTD